MVRRDLLEKVDDRNGAMSWMHFMTSVGAKNILHDHLRVYNVLVSPIHASILTRIDNMRRIVFLLLVVCLSATSYADQPEAVRVPERDLWNSLDLERPELSGLCEVDYQWQSRRDGPISAQGGATSVITVVAQPWGTS